MPTISSKRLPRVISMVPSWTETLLEAGIHVVGRTRYCIHPQQKVKNCPIVGGTKNLDLAIVRNLQPDFVVLDRQENTTEMSDQLSGLNCQILVSDVTCLKTLEAAVLEISVCLESAALASYADRIRELKPTDQNLFLKNIILHGEVPDLQVTKNFEYVIWKKPYMVVGKNTFIADVFRRAGINLQHEKRYPEISAGELKKTFCFFASEPYPFAKKFTELQQEGFRGAVVDGEKLSWFGLRNLRFLEASQIGTP